MSVCPSVRPQKQLVSHRTDFHKILYFSIFRKTVLKFQVSLKSDKNNGTSHEDQITFMIVYPQFVLERKIVHTEFIEK
jgi:hypothetical protein